MHRRHLHVMQRIFVSASVLLVSLCMTFVALYVSMPRSEGLVSVTKGVSTKSTSPSASSPALIIPPPVTLKIDSINIAANVNPVGLTSAGNMDISEEPKQAAWYKLGPKPGEEGSAVIAGHYGWKDGVPSLFNDLNKLVKGSMVTTLDENGGVKRFVVTHAALYAPNQDATNVFKSDDGKAHLNLITCQGSWNNSAKTYSERLVVFTDYTK